MSNHESLHCMDQDCNQETSKASHCAECHCSSCLCCLASLLDLLSASSVRLVLYIAALLLRRSDRKLTWTRVLHVLQHHHSFQTRSLWRERVRTSMWALRVLALLREERPNMICACIAQTTSHMSLQTPAMIPPKKGKHIRMRVMRGWCWSWF